MCNVMYHDKAILLTSDKESELVFDFFFWDIAVFPIRNESTLKKYYTGCIRNTCVKFNQWKNSPNYKTFLYNILQNSLKFSKIFSKNWGTKKFF
jgi:hypothetical protein